MGQYPGDAHLALALAVGLDGGLVNGEHPAQQDIAQLRLEHRLEHTDGAKGEIGQGAAGEIDAVARQTLVLAVQRLVVEELLHQQPGDEAHIGDAARPQRARRGHRGEFAAWAMLEHRVHVIEHDIAGRALRQSIGVLFADQLVFVGVGAIEFRCRAANGPSRYRAIEPKA